MMLFVFWMHMKQLKNYISVTRTFRRFCSKPNMPFGYLGG